jgi:hypothetical protein
MSVRDMISATKLSVGSSWNSVPKFCTYKRCPASEFHIGSMRHASRKAVHEFSPAFSTFLDRSGWNSIKNNLPLCRFAVVGFVKIGAVKTMRYLSERTQFWPHFMHLSYDLNGIRHRNIHNNLSKCKFRENRGSESHSSLRGINEFLFILSLV